jgi:hypothetical protein
MQTKSFKEILSVRAHLTSRLIQACKTRKNLRDKAER